MRKVLSTLALGALLLSGLEACATEAPQEETRATATVGTDGFELTVGDVTARGDADVAPEGTEVTLEVEPRATGGGLAELLIEAGNSVSLTLGDGLQPSTPIDLRFPAPAEESSPERPLVIVTESADGAIGLLEATPDGDFLAATTDHLSWFQPVNLDLGAALQKSRDFLMQALGLELPAPDCVGGVATTTSGMEYRIDYRGFVHPCISASGDQITVNLYAATMMPYRVKSWPEVTGVAVPGDDSEGMLMALSSKWVPSASGGVLMGGGSSAQFTFSASAPPIYLEARQDAHMLIGSVLLDLVGLVLEPLSGASAFMEKAGQLDCASGLLSSGASEAVDEESAAQLFRTILTCVTAAAADASWGVQLALALVAAVPVLFAGVAIGIVNEFTGQSTVRLDVTATQGAIPGVPAELAGKWCTTSGSPCFSFADLRKDHPDAAVEWSGPIDKPGVTRFQLCLEMDLGDSCTTAASMYLDYYPAGIGWDCPTYAVAAGWPRCDPDYTSAHDTSQERLAQVPNHQQNLDAYIDADPMYRQ